MSVRGLEGRQMYLFISHDRPHVLRQIEVAFRGHEVVIDTLLQPRDRHRQPARITIRNLQEEAPADLEWLIELL